uniref:dnaJ homolog subfamily C member 1 isoform X2 n=1 Tax=Pristiophorus japonicus TaxID=55135 RepID=UPI00398EA141
MPSPLSPAAGIWLAASALLQLTTCVPGCRGWDTAELELFDLVDEVQENFYRFLGVEQDASSADIRKAYRKMSLILHPDKNKDENAEIQFRQLVAIYEVLKDEEKRQRSFVKPQWQDLLPCKIGIWFYFILKSLPQCYQAVTDFYREWKEMKIKEKEEAETQAQLEAVQKEKRPKVKKPKSEFPVYTAPNSGGISYVPLHEEASTIEEIEQQMADWLEDRSRGQKKAPEWTEEDLSQLTRSMVKFPGGTPGRWEKIAHELGRSVADVTTKAKQVKDFVSSTSGTIKLLDLKSVPQTIKNAKRETALPDHIITKRDEEEVEGEHEEFENGDDQDNYTEKLATENRLRKRKTAKTSERTLMIQEEIEQKQKGRRQRDFDNTQLDDEDSDEEKKRKGIRSPEEIAELWNQNQQKLLELALQQYPKGTSERWDKIAKCVPGKTKEECIIRYKLLAELVMKRKQAKS